MCTVKNLTFLAIFISIFQNITLAQNFPKQDEKTSLYGVVDENGDYIVKPKYKEIDFNFGYKTGLSYVINPSDKYGFINPAGKEVIPCKYDRIETFENGVIIVKTKIGDYDYLSGIIDSTGKELIPMKYGHFEYYPLDKVIVFGETNTSNVGLMDLSGKVIIEPQYEFWSKRISKGIWPVGKNNICGVVDLKNQTIVPFEYYMIENYSDELGLAVVKKEANGKFGFINRIGKLVIAYEYDDAWPSGDYLSVKKNGKWGLIDVNNKIILPLEYSSISSVYKTTAWVTKNEGEDSFEIDLITKQKIKK